MKRFASFLLLGFLAASHLALAEDDERPRPPAKQTSNVVRQVPQNRGPQRQFTPQVNRFVNGNAQQNFRGRQNSTPRINQFAVARGRIIQQANNRAVINRTTPHSRIGVTGDGAAIRGNVGIENRPPRTVGNGTANYTGNLGGTQHSGRRENWSEHQQFHQTHQGDPNFAHEHRDWHREHETHDWWRSHYDRFCLFGGGYYYFNSGYWYPAYGYDSHYSTYTYNAPIYAYNNQAPGQIIADVQAALQRRGYYQDYVDGDYGPMTRRALIDFQSDNGLPVSGEIDEETLDALGLQ